MSPKFEFENENENECVIEMRSDFETSHKSEDSMVDRCRQTNKFSIKVNDYRCHNDLINIEKIRQELMRDNFSMS
jgi:hypothetical protein